VSARGTTAASKNKHPHKLRPDGYKSAEMKWSKDMRVYSSSDSRGHSQGYVGMNAIFAKGKRKATSHAACDERINSVSKFIKLSDRKHSQRYL
jgi:hypothetical protein